MSGHHFNPRLSYRPDQTMARCGVAANAGLAIITLPSLCRIAPPLLLEAQEKQAHPACLAALTKQRRGNTTRVALLATPRGRFICSWQPGW